VLSVFIERFRPMSWSGSRAALMGANARLLDSLESDVASDLIPFVTEVKAQLAQEVAQERRWGTEQDRARDERFE
jgi:ubiquinone biosynthesis protein UbiJ